jgi:hypothetical protein
MSIQHLMEDIIAALPVESKWLRCKTIREVCLTYSNEEWSVMAGGHPAVNLGEWNGDFQGEGETAEEALINCLHRIRNA